MFRSVSRFACPLHPSTPIDLGTRINRSLTSVICRGTTGSRVVSTYYRHAYYFDTLHLLSDAVKPLAVAAIRIYLILNIIPGQLGLLEQC